MFWITIKHKSSCATGLKYFIRRAKFCLSYFHQKALWQTSFLRYCTCPSAMIASSCRKIWCPKCWNQLTVCSYHVTYAFQSESILYNCLNVKELLAWSRRVIWSLSDWNWLSVRLRTKWFWVRVQFESLIVFIFVFPKLFRSFSFSNKCCVSYLAKPQWYFQKIRANNYIKLEPCHLCSNPMKTFETPFFQIVDFSTRTWFI